MSNLVEKRITLSPTPAVAPMTHVTPLVFDPPVIAHRGVRSVAPENTLPAFALAADQGIRWIETDVKLSHDGVPILFHDDTVERVTNGKGAVADLLWDDLRQLLVQGGISPSTASIPTMQESLRLIFDRGLRVNLELKPCTGRTQVTTMVAMIAAAQMWPEECPPPLISSFDVEALTIASRLHPDWPRGLLLDEWRDDWRELALLVRASSLNINADNLTADRIAEVRASGLHLLAYTVNDPLQAKSLLQQGVSAVFSDNPADILRVL